jgi:hypothetical protein
MGQQGSEDMYLLLERGTFVVGVVEVNQSKWPEGCWEDGV